MFARLLLAAALLVPAPATHLGSLGRSRLEVEGGRVRLLLQCQVASLGEVIQDLDADGDGALSSAELAARAEEVRAYVRAHFRVDVPREGGAQAAEGAPLELDFLGLRRTRVEDAPFRGRVPPRYDDWVDVEAQLALDGPPRALTVASTLFAETSPDHLDLASVRWPGGAEDEALLGPGGRSARFDAPPPRAAGERLRAGARAVAGRWEPFALLLAFALGTRARRELLRAVGAYVLAAVAGGALAGAVDAAQQAPFLGFAAALAVAYVAADALLHPAAERARALEGALFGLLHGASCVAESPAPGGALFALGLAAVAALAACGAVLFGLALAHVTRAADARRRALVVRPLAAALVVAGLAGFLSRL